MRFASAATTARARSSSAPSSPSMRAGAGRVPNATARTTSNPCAAAPLCDTSRRRELQQEQLRRRRLDGLHCLLEQDPLELLRDDAVLRRELLAPTHAAVRVAPLLQRSVTAEPHVDPRPDSLARP